MVRLGEWRQVLLGVGSREGKDHVWGDNEEPLVLVHVEVMLIKETGRRPLRSTHSILTLC